MIQRFIIQRLLLVHTGVAILLCVYLTMSHFVPSLVFAGFYFLVWGIDELFTSVCNDYYCLSFLDIFGSKGHDVGVDRCALIVPTPLPIPILLIHPLFTCGTSLWLYSR